MKTILFLAKYPSEEESKDGMMQRVIAIDKELERHNRIYVQISFRHNLKKECIKHPGLTIYKLNGILHYYLIKRLISLSDYCYFHSIYNFLPVYIYRFQLPPSILDVHGVVSDEVLMAGHKWRHRLFKAIEKYAFSVIQYAIVVSYKMQNHYNSSYPNTVRFIFKPIIPNHLLKQPSVDSSTIEQLKNKYKIKKDTPVILYSGGVQIWQNIALMDEFITSLDNRFRIIILTPQIAEMKKQLKKSATKEYVYIESVSPTELDTYYSISNYGIILRDENIVNTVASPTKLIEYLKFGIIPIVKTPNIGDALNMGYEFQLYTDKISHSTPQKSHKNIEIAQHLISESLNTKLNSIIV